MNIQSLAIPDIKILTPRIFEDSRGYFMEAFNAEKFSAVTAKPAPFIQDNHSFSAAIYTVRGLHYQSPPYAQGKLVRCSRGRILDVAVDIRIGSPTFGQHVTAELSADNAQQLWVPSGFLHGFATLEPNTEVQYKCTNLYAPECDGNILWNDPCLNIDWGFDPKLACLSDKDILAPKFADFKSPFHMA